MEHIPNGHSTLNQPRFDVDIMSIRQRSNLDKFPRHFLILFRCNFADQKVHVISRYFFQPNFASRKIDIVSTYLLRCNFDGRWKSTLFACTIFDYVISMVENSTLFPHTFFNVISMVEKSTSFLLTFFDVISLVEIFTVFLIFSMQFWWSKNTRCFHVLFSMSFF